MSTNEHWRWKLTLTEHFTALFKWTPVVLIFATIGWSYYAYVVELCVYNATNLISMIFCIFFYHITLIMFVWSYWKTIFTSLARIPDQWRIPDEELNQLLCADDLETRNRILNTLVRNLPVENRTINGSVRFCAKCKIIKPDRSHHCKICRCCVLKMDHHCVWVNNCVNFYNYKFFVLFASYALIFCVYVALTSLHDFIEYFRGQSNVHLLFLFFTSVMFALSLLSLFGYHIYLVLVNRTTLESSRPPVFHIGGPNKKAYNLSRYANFCEVFGDDWKYWFLPIFTSHGDGFTYPTSIEHMAYYDSNESRLDIHTTIELIDTQSSLIDHGDHSAVPPHSKDVNSYNTELDKLV